MVFRFKSSREVSSSDLEDTKKTHVKQNQGDLGGAVVHIFRFHNGLIVEFWDVGQPIPENSPNENGVF